jgi:S1-C subfamily serine protease
MTALDTVLLLLAAIAGLVGYRRGLLVGVLSLLGLVAGAALGSALGPHFVRAQASTAERVAVLVVATLGTGLLGQILGVAIGGRLQKGLGLGPLRWVNSGAGAVFGAGALLIAAWLAGSAVASASSVMPVLAGPVARSEVLRFVDGVMPARPQAVYGSLTRALRHGGLPPLFSPFADEQVVAVPAPDALVTSTQGVADAAASVVRVRGAARSCGREFSGSGFVYAPERVMTNAHVVAAVSSPTVQIGAKGKVYRAAVVLFDPMRDVAVLAVPGLPSAALNFDDTVQQSDDMVVAGFPLGGPYEIDPARIRSRFIVRGPDIYDSTTVSRSVYSLYATVRHGNSGGPLLTPAGDVAGMVFGKSETHASTGYALTAAEIASDAAAGAASVRPVGTGVACV